VGGGIRELADAEAVFEAGADKSPSTRAGERSQIIGTIAARFGSQAVVVAIAPVGSIAASKSSLPESNAHRRDGLVLGARSAANGAGNPAHLDGPRRTQAGFDCS